MPQRGPVGTAGPQLHVVGREGLRAAAVVLELLGAPQRRRQDRGGAGGANARQGQRPGAAPPAHRPRPGVAASVGGAAASVADSTAADCEARTTRPIETEVRSMHSTPRPMYQAPCTACSVTM